MVLITKEEKDAIVAQYPNAHIVRTMKTRSKRHRYYCVEDRRVMRILSKMRGQEYDGDKNRNGGGYHNRTRKNAKRERS